MTHEKNMMDYLDSIDHEFLDNHTKVDKIMAHRDFLKSQPKLGDFIPTNKKGEVMEKPKVTWNRTIPATAMRIETESMIYQREYQSALDRVLWKGWEISEGIGYDLIIAENGKWLAQKYSDQKNWLCKFTTYEQLITSGIKLERIQRK